MVNFTPAQVQILLFWLSAIWIHEVILYLKKLGGVHVPSITHWLSVTGNPHMRKAYWPDGRHLCLSTPPGQLVHCVTSGARFPGGSIPEVEDTLGLFKWLRYEEQRGDSDILGWLEIIFLMMQYNLVKEIQVN